MRNGGIPTANTHVHANGWTSNRDVLRLAAKYGVDLSLPAHKRPDYSHIAADGQRLWNSDPSALHIAYDQTVKLIRDPVDLYEVVSGGLKRDARQNCIYNRILSSCMNNCRSSSDAHKVFADNARAIIAAMRHARSEFKIDAFLTISAKRHLKARGENPREGVAMAHRLLDAVEWFQKKHPDEAEWITGFDMAGDEEAADLSDYHSVFERADLPRARKGLGLLVSVHCGEVSGHEDIESALSLPGVKIVSHALSATDNPRLMSEMKTRYILIEQLQTNNRMGQPGRFDACNHPLPDYHEEGMWLALGSDDPGLQGTHIGHEYKAAREKGLDDSALLGFTSNAVRFGFMSVEVKMRLLKHIQHYASDNGILLRPEQFQYPVGRGRFEDLALAA